MLYKSIQTVSFLLQNTSGSKSCIQSSGSKKGAPITVLLLYLWCESHFFMHDHPTEDNSSNSEHGCETSKYG